MNKKFQIWLLLVNILAVLLVILITLSSSGIVRIILGLPFLLFFPGFMLVASLYPRKGELGGMVRVVFSLGLSIAVSAITGFVLNFTTWGIQPHSIVTALGAFTLVTSVIAWYRQRKLTEEEKLTVSFNLKVFSWKGQTFVDKVLNVILLLAVLGTIGAISYGIAVPRVERFTEFYVLGPEGKAQDYPDEISVGESAMVILGIVNQEYESASYRVEISVNGDQKGEINQIVLDHGEKWEREASFTPVNAGENQKVEFTLYKNGELYRQVHLWINVRE